MSEDTALPVRRLTLYKHGVGFVQREGPLTGEAIRLVFRAGEVNDALKSLLVIDRAGGQILGIHYDTPVDRETRLADCPIRLGDAHSVLDLLSGLRGWRVRLVAGDGTGSRDYTGRLLGAEIPDTSAESSRAALLVAILDEASGAVAILPLAEVRQLTVLEARASQDLDFFLNSSRGDEAHRGVVVRLSPGDHQLAINYLLPSPTWRVSYRLIAEPATDTAPGDGQTGSLLLQGWGLFDNCLEEDLQDVTVALVAGQPISFIYDLATSRIPHRPTISDAARVAAAPVEFGEAFAAGVPAAPTGDLSTLRRARTAALARPSPAPAQAATIQELKVLEPVATGADLGELFAYQVLAPVTVRRGESALVPILSEQLPYRRELLFNERKLPAHPVAALRFTNSTGLVLERGPVTVMEAGEYRGEALVPFSKEGAEVYLAFAVELGIAVHVEWETSTQVAGLSIANSLLQIKQALVTRTVYRLESSLLTLQEVTIEHPIDPGASLVDTPEPVARTAEWYRWVCACAPRAATVFSVTQRRFTYHSEYLLDQSYAGLQEYLRNRWLDRLVFDRIKTLLEEKSAIAANERETQQLEGERAQIYGREEQLRKNMAALTGTGEEGSLRRQVVEQLGRCEERIATIEARLAELIADSTRRQAAIDAELARLSVNSDGKSD